MLDYDRQHALEDRAEPGRVDSAGGVGELDVAGLEYARVREDGFVAGHIVQCAGTASIASAAGDVAADPVRSSSSP